MRQRVIYGILKTYKGIFVKKHIGNVQILIVEMEDDFIVLNLLGKMKDGNHVGQMLLRAPSAYINIFLDDFQKTENFIKLEEILSDVPIEDINNFKVIVKKKGKHILSHLNISLSKEHSTGHIHIYFVKGNLNLVMDDVLNNKADIKISANKYSALSNKLLARFNPKR